MEESGRSFALRELAQRMKANAWLLSHAEVVIKDSEDSAVNASAKGEKAQAGKDDPKTEEHAKKVDPEADEKAKKENAE